MAAKPKRKSGGKRGAGATRSSNPFDILDLALPDEELRRLVLRVTTAGDVEPFVHRMVRLMESLDAGRRVTAARVTRGDLATLMSAISRAVRDGRRAAAYDTASLAAHYAYQNGLDYLRELLRYLDQFRSRRRAPRA
jgi:MoxR-like ATPase